MNISKIKEELISLRDAPIKIELIQTQLLEKLELAKNILILLKSLEIKTVCYPNEINDLIKEALNSVSTCVLCKLYYKDSIKDCYLEDKPCPVISIFKISCFNTKVYIRLRRVLAFLVSAKKDEPWNDRSIEAIPGIITALENYIEEFKYFIKNYPKDI